MAIRFSEVKSSRLSDDKKEVIVAGSGKYIGDVELRFARDCLGNLIDALIRAKDSIEPSLDSEVAPNPSVVPLSKRSGSVSVKPNEIRFAVPQSISVTADVSGRGLVLLILNHRLENQQGFALSPDGARQVADGLTKSAEAVLSSSRS